MTNRKLFKATYAKHLEDAIKTHPDAYGFPEKELPIVIQKIFSAIDNGTFCKESPTFKATCRELNIKHTYSGIREFLNS